jgi:hypothetical protein
MSSLPITHSKGAQALLTLTLARLPTFHPSPLILILPLARLLTFNPTPSPSPAAHLSS